MCVIKYWSYNHKASCYCYDFRDGAGVRLEANALHSTGPCCGRTENPGRAATGLTKRGRGGGVDSGEWWGVDREAIGTRRDECGIKDDDDRRRRVQFSSSRRRLRHSSSHPAALFHHLADSLTIRPLSSMMSCCSISLMWLAELRLVYSTNWMSWAAVCEL